MVYGEITNSPYVQYVNEISEEEELESYISAKCDDDEDGALVPLQSVRKAASFLVHLLNSGVPMPDIASGVDGSLGLFWRRGESLAYIDLLADGFMRLFVRAADREDLRRTGNFDAIVDSAYEAVLKVAGSQQRHFAPATADVSFVLI